MKYTSKYLILCFSLIVSFSFSSLSHADIIPIYNDNVSRDNQDIVFEIDAGAGVAFIGLIEDWAAPEGTEYAMFSYGSFMDARLFVDICEGVGCSVDLSRFNEGSLEFSIRLSSTRTDTIRVAVEAPEGTPHNVERSVSNTDWQKITIPLSEFGGLDLTQVHSPFSLTVVGDGSFDIEAIDVDDVGWVTSLPVYPQTTQVSLQDGMLMVNAAQLTVQGVNGEFTPVGEDGRRYLWSEHPEQYVDDVTLIDEMGVNVVRLSQPPTNSEFLDALYDKGIYVIMDYPVAVTTKHSGMALDFSLDVIRDKVVDGFTDMVSHWGGHPAVLMWSLGSGVNNTVDPASKDAIFTLINEAAQAGKAVALPNSHLVTLSLDGDAIADITSKNGVMTDLDVWSVNYKKQSFDTTGEDLFPAYIALATGKPLLITEFGSDAYRSGVGVDESMQSAILQNLWRDIDVNLQRSVNTTNVGIGGVIYAWRDAWYKYQGAGAANNLHNIECNAVSNPDYLTDPCMNDEYWGLVEISADPAYRNTRQAYDTMSLIWSPAPDPAPLAENQEVTIDANTSIEVVLLATDPEGDVLIFSIVDSPSSGVLSDVTAGSVTYTPNLDFSGSDFFTFKANDGTSDSNTARVDIIVEPVIPQTVFTRGNANCAARVDISDAIYVLLHLFLGGPGFDCRDAADVTDDGRVDISDPIRLLGSLFLGLPAPEEPWGGGRAAGTDPTPDMLTCDASCPVQ